MLGRADRQTSFSDYWLNGKISENSFWSILRKWAMENLDEDMFQPLYSYNGRPSVSPVYSFTAMLIQKRKDIRIENLKKLLDLMTESNMQ